jgi:pyridoxal phosphate phosphatase PHOSPHO2
MTQTKRQLVVFDFDWSMIDQDSDRWLLEVLAPDIRRKMRDRSRDVGDPVQWTDLVAECLRELGHAERGITQSDIEGALRQIPFHPAMKRGIQMLKDPSTPVATTLFVLSNANTFFIETILNHQAIRSCFDEIVTNPADFIDPTSQNLLVLRRRVGPNDPPHGCQVGCEDNMCKGKELEEYLDRQREKGVHFDRVMYVGDGSNDFCAVLRMTSRDIVFCRRYRGLERKIADEISKGEDHSRLKCNVEYWSGAWEVEEKFKKYAKSESFDTKP